MSEKPYNFRRSIANQSYKQFFYDDSIDVCVKKSDFVKTKLPSEDFTQSFEKEFRKQIEDIEAEQTLLAHSKKIKLKFRKVKESENLDSNESWTVKACNVTLSELESSSDESEIVVSNNSEVNTEHEITESEFDNSIKINFKNSEMPVDESDELKSQIKRKKDTAVNFYFEPEEYFSKQSQKHATSNNTLRKLRRTTKVADKTTQALLAKEEHVAKVHKTGIIDLCASIKQQYSKWLLLMEEGFNILLNGSGSKRSIINEFHDTMLENQLTLVVNGFFPSLTLKEILDSITTDLLGLKTVANQNECVNLIINTMKLHSDKRIYILIHNIDGGMLRTPVTQDVLSYLASVRNIHFMASIDHVNASLIWDNVKRLRYNFYWVRAVTYLPYTAETSFENSLIVQKSGALALLALRNVFLSLTKNAKGIYIILVKYQLDGSSKNYPGMPFKDLFRECRQAFLVSSDASLRTQLTEFVDHKVVTIKRNNIDGIEYLNIPLDNSLLSKFLEEHDKSD